MIVNLWIFQRVWTVARHMQHSSMTAANGADRQSCLARGRHIKAAQEYQLSQQAMCLTFTLGRTYRTDTLLLLLEAYEHHSSHPWSCSVTHTGTVKPVDCSVGKEGAFDSLLITKYRVNTLKHLYWLEHTIQQLPTISVAQRINVT
jgi:hypothetical protein